MREEPVFKKRFLDTGAVIKSLTWVWGYNIDIVIAEDSYISWIWKFPNLDLISEVFFFCLLDSALHSATNIFSDEP